MTADICSLHGVLLRVEQLGVLLTGSAGIGKSETALQLIQRGHTLVADDAPLFRISQHRLIGFSPDLLADFLEVRGIGILNIRAMYGDNAIATNQTLDLIIDMVPTPLHSERLLTPSRSNQQIQEFAIPILKMPVTPGRYLAPLVEALVRHEKLYQQGYDALGDFCLRQRQRMDEQLP